MDKDFWDTRYAEPDFAYGLEANAFLVSLADRFVAGQRALVIGDGEGRNGVWLAEQGLSVLSVDQSVIGMEKARQLAQQRGVNLETECVDLLHWDWPQAQFDWVVSIYVHFPPDIRARMHANCMAALRPGGEIIMEAFTPEQLNYASGGPPVREMLYDAAMMKADFAAAEILQLDEAVLPLAEGKYHVGDGAVLRARFRRPLA